MWRPFRTILIQVAARGLGRALLLVARSVAWVVGTGSERARAAAGTMSLLSRSISGRASGGVGRGTVGAGHRPPSGLIRLVAAEPRSRIALGLPRSLRVSPWRVTAATAATVVLVWVLGGAAVGAAHLTSNAGVCRQCHEMQTYYDTWSASEHSGAECSACHIRPGLIGLIEAKITGVRQLYVHFSGGEQMPLELSADVPNEACRTCHPAATGGRRQESAFDQHPAHEGERCIYCHEGVVHGRDPERPPLGSMASCLECHRAKRDGGDADDEERDGSSPPSACVTCHEPPHADTGECGECHELDDWTEPVPLSASISADSCRECHARPRDMVLSSSVFTHGEHVVVDCSPCHAGILHPSSRPAVPPTMDYCLQCHDGATREGLTAPSTCETCHEPPHAEVGGCAECHTADDWAAAVPLAETVTAGVCLQCHRTPADVAYGRSGFSHDDHRARPCVACHAGALHPVSGTADRLSMEACETCHRRAGASTDCTVCHSPPHPGYGSCTGCHSRSSWQSRFVHPFKLVGRHASLGCSSCHGGTPVLGAKNTRLSAACSSCHGDSTGPGHDGLKDCARCHDPKGWEPSRFAHAQVPGMAVSAMSCSQCHPAGYAAYTCAPCHDAGGP